VHIGRSWLCLPAAVLTIARNWVGSLGKLAIYSSFTIHMYSGYYLRLGRSIITVVLWKEGKVDYLIPGSYRPIALENTLSKILEKVIADRIADTAKEYALLL
jgi:hypothetical protein